MSSTIEVRGVLFPEIEGLERLIEPLSFMLKPGERMICAGSQGSAVPKILDLLNGLSRLEQGECFVLGASVKSGLSLVRNQISFATNFDSFEDSLTVIENMVAYGELFGLHPRQSSARALKILRQFELDEMENRPVAVLSPIVRRLIGLASALLPEPQLLLLDRVSQGLKAEDARTLWGLLNKALPQTLTVFGWELEVGAGEDFFSRVLLLKNGRVILDGSPSEIVADRVGVAVMDCHLEPGQLEYFLARLGDRYRYQASLDRFLVYIKSTAETEQVLRLVQTRFFEIRPARLSDIESQIQGESL